ncbi:MAG TPA: hypothetical protein PKC72_08480 [Chitinophagaceae bacterium]|nr:hypothetical protein [Chitinophagaceae bacterium]
MMNESPSENIKPHPSSFRDPSGFVFEQLNILYRQVNQSYKEHYDHLTSSGLYEYLVTNKLLIPHIEAKDFITEDHKAYKIIKPEKIDLISYPCEWSFDMMKDAALLTLKIAIAALNHGMILKDATPYNIQWHRGRLVFIDTLSFEKYEEGKPWIAYRQFCECFLSPLLLMHYKKTDLHEMQLAYPEGIPLEITRRLLPGKSRFSILTWLHIHVHAKYSRKNAEKKEQNVFMSQKRLMNLFASLQTLIQSLHLKDIDTTWGNYYEEAAQRKNYLGAKKEIIRNWLNELPILQTGVDFGSNNGEFTLLLVEKNITSVAMDIDPVAINKLYLNTHGTENRLLQPLLIDLSNPTPSYGLNNKERLSLLERLQHRDIGLHLALIHHLCLGKNIPFPAIASVLANCCQYLIIEFVPKSDCRSQQLLSNKRDIYDWYTEELFEKEFGVYFRIQKKASISESGRTLFLMETVKN